MGLRWLNSVRLQRKKQGIGRGFEGPTLKADVSFQIAAKSKARKEALPIDAKSRRREKRR